jgi:hypothetical protein
VNAALAGDPERAATLCHWALANYDQVPLRLLEEWQRRKYYDLQEYDFWRAYLRLLLGEAEAAAADFQRLAPALRQALRRRSETPEYCLVRYRHLPQAIPAVVAASAAPGDARLRRQAVAAVQACYLEPSHPLHQIDGLLYAFHLQQMFPDVLADLGTPARRRRAANRPSAATRRGPGPARLPSATSPAPPVSLLEWVGAKDLTLPPDWLPLEGPPSQRLAQQVHARLEELIAQRKLTPEEGERIRQALTPDTTLKLLYVLIHGPVSHHH